MADTNGAAAPAASGGGGTTAGPTTVGLGLAAFIFFLVVLWAVWHAQNRFQDGQQRLHDVHVMGLRATDAIGYQSGYIQKQLNDMQMDQRAGFREMNNYELNSLRFGMPPGNHTFPLRELGRRFGPGVVNGSNITDTNSFSSDNSVF